MINHLRIALKHLQKSMDQEVTCGNYRVRKVMAQNIEAILVTHLKFMGEDEFNTCHWLPQNRTLFICQGADAATDEIVFTIRSLKRLGAQIAYIISSTNTDVTKQFSRYLSD